MANLKYDTLIIHTLQRTGGSSIVDFCEDAFIFAESKGPEVIRCFYLNDRYRYRSAPQKVIERARSERVGVISVARNPVERNVSWFWHIMANKLGDRVTKDNCLDWFYASVPHFDQHTWWGGDYIPFWGIDIFEQAEKYVPPYMIMGDNLITRVDDLSHFPKALSEFAEVDATFLDMPHINTTEPKYPMALSKEYIEFMNHPYEDTKEDPEWSRARQNWKFPRWFYGD
jgi:hypothetical protein